MARRSPARPGFTLVEILVVLIMMGLAAALVAPALLALHHHASTLNDVVAGAREAAARRGEVLYLSIEPTGRWRLEGGANPLEGTPPGGRLGPFPPAPVTPILAPLWPRPLDGRRAAPAGALTLAPP